jgi:hypothetical protein
MINKTILPPPPPLHLGAEPQKYWNFKVQNLAPLIEVDTSGGNETQSPPSAGVNASTGQTNQNQEITYVKISPDANVFSLQGPNLPFGPYTLAAQSQSFKIKSNGTVWYKVA